VARQALSIMQAIGHRLQHQIRQQREIEALKRRPIKLDPPQMRKLQNSYSLAHESSPDQWQVSSIRVIAVTRCRGGWQAGPDSTGWPFHTDRFVAMQPL
jgi:hypothetical protein